VSPTSAALNMYNKAIKLTTMYRSSLSEAVGRLTIAKNI
jgi:hypothetical protein